MVVGQKHAARQRVDLDDEALSLRVRVTGMSRVHPTRMRGHGE